LVAYRLSPPWHEYAYGLTEFNDQWWEFWREPGNELWLASVRAQDGSTFLATTNPDENWLVREFVVDAENRQIMASRYWVDTPRRLRGEYLRSYEGLRLDSVVADGERLRLFFGEDRSHEVVVTGQMTVTPSIVVPVRYSSVDESGTATPVAEALNQLVGKMVQRAESPQDGSLDLGFERSGTRLVDSDLGLHIRVLAGDPPGCWTASAPTGWLASPGADGWAQGPLPEGG
jgi:hypothetical protein